jgi:hypothetical protein
MVACDKSVIFLRKIVAIFVIFVEKELRKKYVFSM